MDNGGATGTDGASEARPTVLVVEDERPLAELYEAWLSGRYELRLTHDGEAGLAAMDDSVDVVLLDRRMPGPSGDEVLRQIKDAGYDAPVVLVTAVDADTDIVDLPIDDYVGKPVTRSVLLGVVARMVRLADVEEPVRRYHSLERRRDVLRAARASSGIADPEAFERLTKRLEAAAKDAGAGLAWLKEDYYDADAY